MEIFADSHNVLLLSGNSKCSRTSGHKCGCNSDANDNSLKFQTLLRAYHSASPCSCCLITQTCKMHHMNSIKSKPVEQHCTAHWFVFRCPRCRRSRTCFLVHWDTTLSTAWRTAAWRRWKKLQRRPTWTASCLNWRTSMTQVQMWTSHTCRAFYTVKTCYCKWPLSVQM